MHTKDISERYTLAAQSPEAGLCCPVQYNPELLRNIPEEVLSRDYGCGDPSSYVRAGEIVVDLGSGSGKLCFIAAQIVGASGKIIGIDINDEMLAVARRAAPEMASRVGYSNTEFRKGRIEDLRLDCEKVDNYLQQHPIRSESDLRTFEEWAARSRKDHPLIPDASIDLVLSNCVLNLISPDARHNLFKEIHRVLKRGGRAIISDIVSDEDVPTDLQADPHLWSGCYVGAMREDRFVSAFADAGLYGITLLKRTERPWQVIQGIEFRSVTVAAYKGKEGPCWDHLQAVVYTGPFRRVEDDDGHVMERGQRIAVCEKTFTIYRREPYSQHFQFIEPASPLLPEAVKPFPCDRPSHLRDPRETKGQPPEQEAAPVPSCKPGCC